MSTFDLHRRSKTKHMGFGHGIHACVGAPLARLEGQAVLEALATRLPSLRLAPGQDLRHIPQLIFRGYEKLEVTFDNGGASTGLRSTERTEQS